MKHITCIFISIFFVCCAQKKPDNSRTIRTDSLRSLREMSFKSNDTIDIVKSISPDKRINLDKILNQKHNDYMASIDDCVLSLCCYKIIDVSRSIDFKKFKKTTENYKLANHIKIIEVYYLGDSYIKEYYNDELKHNDLICGKITNSKLITNSDIQIGMTKTQLLDKIFLPTKIIKKISRLDIYENELGAAYTSYRFLNDTLIEIIFDSSYDWIDKRLKK